MELQPASILSSIKRGVDSVGLTPEDLKDKIINLKITQKAAKAGDTPKSFTIRSDYEILFDASGGFQYVDCLPKPAIKIEYKQVANDTVVAFTVDVSNLFIKDPSTIEANGEPIQQIEIQMGYKTQMPDWARGTEWKTKPLEDFYALKTQDDSVLIQYKIPATSITAQVLSVEKLSSPPDMVTRFNCVVGTLENGLRWLFDSATLAADTAQQTKTAWGETPPSNSLPDLFLLLVTRRFVRASVRHDLHETLVPSSDSSGNAQVTKEQTVTIYDGNGVVVKTMDWQDGRMSIDDAAKYGVTVYLSKVLWNHPVEELPAWDMSEQERAQIQPVAQPINIELQEKLPAQLNVITKNYPYIRFYALVDGSYYAYHAKEGMSDFANEPFIRAYAEKQKGIFKIPAVFDITWGGTRQIRMPFVAFIGSMTLVAFQAKYALNDLTGNYYHPAPENNLFLVLLSDVSFSTVGKENMMTLTCTDMPGVAITNPDGSMSLVPLKADPAPAERKKVWKKQDWTVSNTSTGAPYLVDATWASIINYLIASATGYLSAWGGTMPTVAQALDALVSWNSANLFTSGRLTHAVSEESALLGRQVPILFGAEFNPFNSGHGDVIHVQLPFLPSDKYLSTEMIT